MNLQKKICFARTFAEVLEFGGVREADSSTGGRLSFPYCRFMGVKSVQVIRQQIDSKPK
jgi:hypothetical protein